MRFADRRSRRVLFKEFFNSDGDPYKIREFDDLKYIIDIGANVGLFSMQARFTHTKANIYAIEPFPTTFELLQDNVANLRINCLQAMLGKDGKGAYAGGRMSLSRTFRTGEGDIDSISLAKLVEHTEYPIEECFIKIDCEGGEHSILDNPDDMDILRNCKGFAMEIHRNLDQWNVFLEEFPEEAFLQNSTGRMKHVVVRNIR
jgi:FkbM family methyltransferase